MTMHPLADPLADLDAQRAQFDWDAHDVMRLDERYRTRHLPLLHETPRLPMRPGELREAEYWPPIRSVVLPVDDAALRADAVFGAFLDDLRAALGSRVWWPGLALRADRVHTTLAPELNPAATLPETPLPAVRLIVRGPWVGRHNTGRVYLPVQAADSASVRRLDEVRALVGAERRPMLAGYLQLTGDLRGEPYAALRRLVRHYQTRVRVPLSPAELWLMDTMDDLVLRSRVVQRVPFAV
ncbi:hypothetical protein ACFQO7_04465 [Catellatospora aurea]|uniref:Uncharacterized protein n=1 Tax=Catellatospora aurea TaxID=1337874 RepID=A0ABW2GP45_9ACTN